MPSEHKNIIHVVSKNPPTVELDSAAHAAYIRFSNERVEKTAVVDVDNCLVTMDIAESGNVIGVELVGVQEFQIDSLIEKAGIRGISDEMIRKTRYVPANAEVVSA